MTPGMKRRLGNACFADRWSHAKARSREGKCASLCSVQGQASRGRESAGVRSFCERRRQYVAPGPFRTRVAWLQLFEIAWRRLSAFRRWVMGVLQTAWFHAKARRREGKQAGLFLVLSQASRGRKSAGVRSFCERRRPYGAPGHFRTRLACWQLFEIAWRRLSAFRCRVMCVLQTAGLTRSREVAKGNKQVCFWC